MRTSSPAEIRKNNDNLARFHSDGATSAVEDAAVNYQAPSIIAAGADAQSVSVFSVMVNLSLALVCLKAPALIEKAGLTRRGAVILAFINLLAWVPLTMAFFLAKLGIAPIWLAMLWFVNLAPGVLLSVQRDNWLSNIVPQGSLGRYLGQRLAIKSAFYLGAFILLGFLLDTLGQDNLAGFAIVFTIAIVMALFDFIIFTFMYERPEDTAPQSRPEKLKFGFLDYFNELKQKKLDTFISFTTFFYLTVGLSGPLYAVYMLDELHYSYLSFTVIISAEFLARIISSPFWGRFADKAGNIRVLGIVTRIIPVIPIFWLFNSSLIYLAFVQIMSGICWGAFDLCTQSYLYKVAPRPKKLRYIVYTRFLILACTAMGSLAGAYLVEGVFTTFGSKILTVFWVSGFCRALVVLYMMPKLVDLAVTYGQPAPPPDVNLEKLGKAILSKRGLFYRPEIPELSPAAIQLQKEAAAAEYSRYAGSRKWPLPKKPAPPPEQIMHRLIMKPAADSLVRERNQAAAEAILQIKALTRAPGKTTEIPARPAEMPRGIYQFPETLGTGAVKKNSRPAAEEKPAVAPASSYGLYQDPVGWAAYMKESFNAIMQDKQAQRVPVLVESRRREILPGEIRPRDLVLKPSRRSPVLA